MLIQKIGFVREGKKNSKSARKIGVTKEKSRNITEYWSKTIEIFPRMNLSKSRCDIKTSSLQVRFKVKV